MTQRGKTAPISRLPMLISLLIPLFSLSLSLGYIQRVQSMFPVKKRQPNMTRLMQDTKAMFHRDQKLHSYCILSNE